MKNLTLIAATCFAILPNAAFSQSCPSTSPKFDQVRTSAGRQMVAAIPRGQAFEAQVASSGGAAASLAAGRDALAQLQTDLRDVQDSYAQIATAPCLRGDAPGSSGASALCSQINLTQDTILVTEGMNELLACRAGTTAGGAGAVSSASGLPLGSSAGTTFGQKMTTAQAAQDQFNRDDVQAKRDKLVATAEAGWRAPNTYETTGVRAGSLDLVNPLALPDPSPAPDAPSPSATADWSAASGALVPRSDQTSAGWTPVSNSPDDALARQDASASGWQSVPNDSGPKSPDSASADPNNQAPDCERLLPYSAQLNDAWLKAAHEWGLFGELKNFLQHERECQATLNSLRSDSPVSQDCERFPTLWENLLPEIQLVVASLVPESKFLAASVTASQAIIVWLRENVQHGAIDAIADGVAHWSGDELEDTYGPLKSLFDYLHGDTGIVARDELIRVVNTQLNQLDLAIGKADARMQTIQRDLSNIQGVTDAIHSACGTPGQH